MGEEIKSTDALSVAPPPIPGDEALRDTVKRKAQSEIDQLKTARARAQGNVELEAKISALIGQLEGMIGNGAISPQMLENAINSVKADVESLTVESNRHFARLVMQETIAQTRARITSILGRALEIELDDEAIRRIQLLSQEMDESNALQQMQALLMPGETPTPEQTEILKAYIASEDGKAFLKTYNNSTPDQRTEMAAEIVEKHGMLIELQEKEGSEIAGVLLKNKLYLTKSGREITTDLFHHSSPKEDVKKRVDQLVAQKKRPLIDLGWDTITTSPTKDFPNKPVLNLPSSRDFASLTWWATKEVAKDIAAESKRRVDAGAQLLDLAGRVAAIDRSFPYNINDTTEIRQKRVVAVLSKNPEYLDKLSQSEIALALFQGIQTTELERNSVAFTQFSKAVTRAFTIDKVHIFDSDEVRKKRIDKDYAENPKDYDHLRPERLREAAEAGMSLAATKRAADHAAHVAKIEAQASRILNDQGVTGDKPEIRINHAIVSLHKSGVKFNDVTAAEEHALVKKQLESLERSREVQAVGSERAKKIAGAGLNFAENAEKAAPKMCEATKEAVKKVQLGNFNIGKLHVGPITVDAKLADHLGNSVGATVTGFAKLTKVVCAAMPRGVTYHELLGDVNAFLNKPKGPHSIADVLKQSKADWLINALDNKGHKLLTLTGDMNKDVASVYKLLEKAKVNVADFDNNDAARGHVRNGDVDKGELVDAMREAAKKLHATPQNHQAAPVAQYANFTGKQGPQSTIKKG